MKLSDAAWIIPLLEGVKNGRTLQYRPSLSSDWANCSPVAQMAFNDKGCYRLKPVEEKFWIARSPLYTPVVFLDETCANNFVKSLEPSHGWEVIPVKTY